MELVLLALLVPAVFVALGVLIGWWAGRRALRRSLSVPEPGPLFPDVGSSSPVAADDRAALARAWQEGYEAAATFFSPVRSFPDGAPRDRAPSERGLEPMRVQGGAAQDGTAEPRAVPVSLRRDPAGAGPIDRAVEPPPKDGAEAHGPAAPAPVDPERRTLRNINITLYVASMLLVAAASLFIGIAFPPGVKFAGLLLLTATFYVGGLAVHTHSERLRPAAVAFTGTGLALIPVAGLALHLLITVGAPVAWFATSIVGTAAFVHAAARLQSKVLAALSLTFLVSTAWSGGAVLNRGLVWYFMFTILLAGVATLAASARPRWLANVYVVAFTAAHRYLVPSTLLVALLLVGTLASTDYVLVFLAATAYYAAAAAFGLRRDRIPNMYAWRATSVMAAVALAAELGAGPAGLSRTAAVLLLVQGTAVILAKVPYARWLAEHGSREAAARVESRNDQARGGEARANEARTDQPRNVRRQWATGPETVVGEGLALFAGGVLCAAFGNERLMGGDPGLGAAHPWWSFNWTLLLVVVVGTHAALREGGRYGWIPIAGGVAVLLEPWDPSPWRQAIVLLVALEGVLAARRKSAGAIGRRMGVLGWPESLASRVVQGPAGTSAPKRGDTGPSAVIRSGVDPSGRTRGEPGQPQLAQGVAIRVLLPVAAANVAGWAASGWAVPGSASHGAAGGGPGTEAAMIGGAVLRAWLLAYAVAWLANTVVAAIRLRGGNTPERRLLSAASEAVLLPLGVAMGLTATLVLLADGALSVDGGAAREGAGALGVSGTSGQVLGPRAWLIAPWPSEWALGATIAVAVVAATLVLGIRGLPAPEGPRGIRGRRIRGAAHATGVLGLAGGVALGGTFRAEWGVGAVLVLGLAYCSARCASPGRPWVRGVYAAGGQLFLTAFALHLAGRHDADAHATAAIAALTLAAGQSARLVLQRGKPAHGGIGLHALMGWATFGLLTAGPFAYGAANAAPTGTDFGYLAGYEPGVDQASLLVQLICLGVFATLWWRHGDGVRGHAGRRWTVVAVALAAGGIAVVPSGALSLRDGGWLPDPLWNLPAAVLLLVSLAAAAIVAEAWNRSRSRAAAAYTGPRGAAAAGLLAAALAVAPVGEPGWKAPVLVMIAAGFAVFAATSGIPWLLLGTALALPAAVYAGVVHFVQPVGPDALSFEPVVFLATQVASGAVLYAAGTVRAGGRRWISGEWVPQWWTPGHSVVCAGGGLANVGLGGLAAQGESAPLVYVGLLTIAASAVAAVFEWPSGRRTIPAEAAYVVVAACLHRAWWVAVGGAGYFWAVQYWVVVLALAAAFHYLARRGARGTAFLCVGAGLLSASGLTSVFVGGAERQIWTLTGHAALLAFGLLSNRRVFVVWGAAGVGLAVLWYLRGYTFLLLLLLAVALIGVAVWRLSKIGGGRT